MKASVVICTFARPKVVKKLLMQLGSQGYDNFEVIVISQGNVNDFEEISSGQTDISFPLKLHHEVVPNLPRARNIGIREAEGEIVLFIDDDVKPNDNLIFSHIANYSDVSIGIVGGRVLNDKLQEKIPYKKVGMIRSLDGFIYCGFDNDVRKENVMHAQGVNMSVRKSAAIEVGGFDERFEGTAEYEDMDFCQRVFKKGYKIVFDPKAIVEHRILSTGGCRAITKEEAVYWLYRNHSLAFLKNFNKLFYPILIIEYALRIFIRSLRWCNFKVILSAFKGIRDGWKAYRSVAKNNDNG